MNAKRQKALDLIRDQQAKARAITKAAQRYLRILDRAEEMVISEDTKAAIKRDTSNTIDIELTRAMLTQVKQSRDAVVALTVEWPAEDPETTITNAE